MIVMLQQEYPYWLTLVLAIVAGGFLVRVFILFHDCCHGSFFASRRANTILGYVTGILTFTAFEDWRYAHNRHHATAGNLDRRGVGDIWTMTTEEYETATRRTRLAYRIYRNPFILFGPGAALLFLLFQRFSKRGAGKGALRSVWITNLALLLVLAVAVSTIGLRTYLLIQLPVILVGGGVPKILQWFTGNIGLHHIHHVQPSIPNYNLQQCYNEIPVLQAVNTITLKTSLRSLRLGLYDETNKKLVGFRSLVGGTRN